MSLESLCWSDGDALAVIDSLGDGGENVEAYTGLRGEWLPALGNTGRRLFDTSKQSVWGTFSTLAASGWITTADPLAPTAIYFSGVDERVVVTSSALPFLGSTWIWVGRAASPGSTMYFMTYGKEARAGFRCVLDTNSPARVIAQVENTSGSYIGRNSGYVFTTDEWHVVAVTIAPGASASSDVKIWLDGVQVDATNNTSRPYEPAGQLWIGSCYSGYNSNTRCSRVACYDRVLSPSEIMAQSRDVFANVRPRVESLPGTTAAAGGIPFWALQSPSQILGGGVG